MRIVESRHFQCIGDESVQSPGVVLCTDLFHNNNNNNNINFYIAHTPAMPYFLMEKIKVLNNANMHTK